MAERFVGGNFIDPYFKAGIMSSVIIQSFIYSSAQMFVGLLVHPYRSMQLLVRHRPLLPFVFYPSALLGVVLAALNLVVQLGWWYQQVWWVGFLLQTLMFYCFYWQLVLLYLFWRFYLALPVHHAN